MVKISRWSWAFFISYMRKFAIFLLSSPIPINCRYKGSTNSVLYYFLRKQSSCHIKADRPSGYSKVPAKSSKRAIKAVLSITTWNTHFLTLSRGCDIHAALDTYFLHVVYINTATVYFLVGEQHLCILWTLTYCIEFCSVYFILYTISIRFLNFCCFFFFSIITEHPSHTDQLFLHLKEGK